MEILKLAFYEFQQANRKLNKLTIVNALNFPLFNLLKFTLLKNKTEQIAEIKLAIENISKQIDENPSIKLFYERAEQLIKLNEIPKAINDYNKILVLNANETYAKTQLDFLTNILKYKNTDIYANPNTNFDPWLE